MRFLVVFSIAAWGLILSPGAMAQELSIEEALSLCMKIGNSGERLECFEALARAAAPVESAKIEKTRPKTPSIATVTTLPRNSDNIQDDDTGKTVAGLEVKRKKKRGGFFPFNRLKKSKQKYVFVKPEDIQKNTSRFGKTVKRKSYDAKVLKSWRNRIDQLYIALDNGEVWEYAGRGRLPMPKPDTSVHIKPSMAGSWFMSLANNSRRFRVRQVQ